uniref:Uncharacterized protein n=1 Tax=Caenorhabditis japonica TaxID=281687 RepID=A0A8R1I6E8_CAEJA
MLNYFRSARDGCQLFKRFSTVYCEFNYQRSLRSFRFFESLTVVRGRTSLKEGRHNDSHNFSLPICALTCLLDCVSRAQAIFCPTGQHSNHASHLSSLRATTLSRHGPSITIGTMEYAPSCQITVCASTAANLYAATSHRTFQKDMTRLSTGAAIKGGQSNHSGAVCVTTPLSTFYTCFGS